MTDLETRAREYILTRIQPSIVGPDAVSLELYEAVQNAIVSVRWE